MATSLLSGDDIFKKERAIFEQFKALHPNTAEKYHPCITTESDVKRWQYHIAQMNGMVPAELWEPGDTKAARQLADSRRFETWEQMPPYMQHNYLKIADCYAGFQCYAVGSRVNGEYVELWGNRYVRRMREVLGKSDKMESDYDYMVDFEKTEPCSFLDDKHSFKADRLRHLPPGEHKIKIPMWDFSKLPDDKKQEAKELYTAQQWGKLMKMHNDYELSQNHYCCDEAPIIKWFRWAIENGKLD